jgi:hypothetical protein
MPTPPSLTRSRWLCDIRTDFNLSDPYRYLNPEKREFTYTPRTGRNSRSRLDYFLVSDSILGNVCDCGISNTVSTTLFDHKSISLSLSKRNIGKSNIIANNTIIHPRYLMLIAAVTLETYLQHAVPDQDGLHLQVALRELGNFYNTFRELNELELQVCLSGNRNEEHVRRLNDRLLLLSTRFPDPTVLNRIILAPNADIFFETLTNNIRNESLGFQGWLRKVDNCKINSLRNRLDRLKEDYLPNSNLISDHESTLADLNEAKLKDKVDNIKIFENLSSEKPSPIFLSLAKNSSSGLVMPTLRYFTIETLRFYAFVNKKT